MCSFEVCDVISKCFEVLKFSDWFLAYFHCPESKHSMIPTPFHLVKWTYVLSEWSKCAVWARVSVFHFAGWIICSVDWFSRLSVLFSYSESLLTFFLLDLPVTEGGVGVNSSISSCSAVLPHEYWSSVVRYLYIKDCHVFLKNGSFIIIVIPCDPWMLLALCLFCVKLK